MIDTLLTSLKQAVPVEQTLAIATEPAIFLRKGYGVVTLHRPANVDHPAVLERLLRVLTELSMALPSVFRCIHAPKQSSNRPAWVVYWIRRGCCACRRWVIWRCWGCWPGRAWC